MLCEESGRWGGTLCSQPRHAQRADKVAQWQVVLVVHLDEASQLLLGDDRVILSSNMANHKFANLEVWVGGLDDLGNTLIRNDRVELEGRAV